MTSHPSSLVNNPSGEGQHDEQRNISSRWRQMPFVISVLGSNPRREAFQHIWNVLVVLAVMLLFSQSWILWQKPPWNRNHMGALNRQHFEDQQVSWWIAGGRQSETEDGADGWTWMDGLCLLVHKSVPGGGWGGVVADAAICAEISDSFQQMVMRTDTSARWAGTRCRELTEMFGLAPEIQWVLLQVGPAGSKCSLSCQMSYSVMS